MSFDVTLAEEHINLTNIPLKMKLIVSQLQLSINRTKTTDSSIQLRDHGMGLQSITI